VGNVKVVFVVVCMSTTMVDHDGDAGNDAYDVGDCTVIKIITSDDNK
jgi:hypothetical protein